MRNTYLDVFAQQYYRDILQDPVDGTEGLTREQLKRIGAFARFEIDEVWDTAIKLFESDPNFWYGSTESITGKELENFVAKQAPYKDAVQVIKTIDAKTKWKYYMRRGAKYYFRDGFSGDKVTLKWHKAFEDLRYGMLVDADYIESRVKAETRYGLR